ncbi:MAG TPA: sugar transferase [Ferruginibacter sp.]|mgnify:FL=1|jgi:lipopolysaccharide/colanic/teichoic acid biosynthesis glycosyltransferase|nr:sugar transferase [Chitinophagales bacterium]HMU72671.1 sugar transferase [Ferruginibacter sp.]HMW27089.1 sugar transferase [Ferruginibacter sp.]HMX36119.1 sugar transferase [Ferruginibacter sp.]HNA00912.1 sugar transferase [Ferruginibacter sp.]
MYPILKRIFDILIAGIALVLLSPILIPSIMILLVTGEREVFYFQKRIGYKNRPFDIWKFATMLKNSPNIGTGEITLRNDPRVTKFGKILRMTKVNELPQIINVFKGDMSIVGPRPLMEVSFKLYPEDVQRVIYNCRPGMTGIGSLIFRDEEKIVSEAADPKAMYAAIYPYKGALELWYQKNASLYTDFMIIFLTAWSILFPENKLVNKVFKDLPSRSF